MPLLLDLAFIVLQILDAQMANINLSDFVIYI